MAIAQECGMLEEVVVKEKSNNNDNNNKRGMVSLSIIWREIWCERYGVFVETIGFFLEHQTGFVKCVKWCLWFGDVLIWFRRRVGVVMNC